MNVFEAARQAKATDVAEWLGLDGKVKCQSPSRAAYKCPYHYEKTASFYAYNNPGRNNYYCFGCHKYCDTIELAGHVLNKGPYDAARLICRQFGYDYDTRQPLKERPPLPGPSAETRAIAAFLAQWRKRNLQYWLDVHERLNDQMRPYIESDMDDTPAFEELLEKSAQAFTEHERWNAMSIQGLLEEVQAAMRPYQEAQKGDYRKVRLIGTVT